MNRMEGRLMKVERASGIDAAQYFIVTAPYGQQINNSEIGKVILEHDPAYQPDRDVCIKLYRFNNKAPASVINSFYKQG
jgi:hypothetical protein